MAPQVTIPALWEMKAQNRKITALTAYDFTFARIHHAGESEIIGRQGRDFPVLRFHFQQGGNRHLRGHRDPP